MDLENKMECIHAVAEVLYDLLDEAPKAQALVSIIMDYSDIKPGE